MNNQLMKTIVFIVFALAYTTVFSANQWVKVVDQAGLPVENAIVSFEQVQNHQAKAQSPLIIRQLNMQFLPKVLIVAKGEQVLFPNEDKTRHHVYSFSTPKTFEIKLYQGLPSKPLTFDKPGLVTLGCNIHDSMVGYIYVTENASAAISDSAGMSSFNTVSLPNEVIIWHADNKDAENTSRVTLTKTNEANVLLGKITLRPTLPQKPTTFKSRFGR